MQQVVRIRIPVEHPGRQLRGRVPERLAAALQATAVDERPPVRKSIGELGAFLGNNATLMTESSDIRPTPPRHRADVASMAWGLTPSTRTQILWQLPQLFLITVAEILVSVTGLEYSYEKAPEAMRASVSALYLLTTAVGDLMGGFLFVAAGHLGVSRPAVLFLCAVLVLLTAVAYRVVARKHFDGFETKPVQTEEDPAEELQAVENVLLRG